MADASVPGGAESLAGSVAMATTATDHQAPPAIQDAPAAEPAPAAASQAGPAGEAAPIGELLHMPAGLLLSTSLCGRIFLPQYGSVPSLQR